MDVKSLQEVNSEYLNKRRSKMKLKKTAANAAFWICVILMIVAVLSFNYNSFLTRPVFGYSLYLTEGEKNLMLVKNVDDFDPSLTAETIYKTGSNMAVTGVCSNSHQTVEIGIVKATFPTLGKMLSFLINKAHILFFAAIIWIVMALILEARTRNAGHGTNHSILDLFKKEVRK